MLKCSVSGCMSLPIARGLCDMHYCRIKRHGSTDQTRAKDWGKREKHPLYSTWNGLTRKSAIQISPEWKDFWQFVKDVGERPSKDHLPCKIDLSLVYSKDNFFWKETFYKIVSNEAQKETKKRWSAERRLLYPEAQRESSLKKNYGIGIADFNVMLSKQNNVCAICGKPEKDLNHNTGTPRNLAVDHDHKTGKIRGLLCGNCNKGLGKFLDDPELLLKAVNYLKGGT